MNPRQFLDLANDLVTGTREAEWRSAVSRAYYATFHVAGNLLRRCGFNVPRAEQAHGYLWLRLSNCGHPDLERAGDSLKDLRTERNRADYDLHQAQDEGEAVNSVQFAEDIIRPLEEAAELPHVLQQITEAMRAYERDVLGEVTWRAPAP
jgi:uncharacterized protein (UPF0332 family)